MLAFLSSLRREWKSSLVLLAIVIFAFGIRLLQLDQAPKGALIDEAHFGYLAYSLLETGKDEHGVSWPIIFKGFGDQKLPGYGYALLPFVKVLGLSTFTIRIPSLLAGTFLVLAVYLLIKELRLDTRWALFGAFVTAVAPWSFFLSRMGFESNLALVFWVFGLWAVVRAVNLKTKTGWWITAAILIALTWYCYIAYRPVTVAVVGAFLLTAWWLKQITWQKIAVFGVSFVIAVFPLFLPSAIGSNATRFNQVGLFADRGLTAEINENRTFCDFKLPRLFCYAIWNKGTIFSRLLIERYIYTFAPQYLGTKGEDGLIFLTVKDYGQFYFVLYPFFILGLLALINPPKKFNLDLQNKVLLGAGLAFAPIPTILVGEAQKVRISSLFPFILIIIVLGVSVFVTYLKKEWLQKLFLTGLVSFIMISAVAHFVAFFTVHTVKNDYYYQTYLPDAFQYLSEYGRDTDIIIKPFFSDPLMFYAYYAKLDPAFYQQNAVLGEQEPGGFQHTIKLANYSVEDTSLKTVACKVAKTGKPTVFVSNIEEDGDYKYTVYSLNGSLRYIFIYDIQRYLAKRPGLCE
ncbi:MAG TPA: glycosyltransferase family 39 protein [Vitreimonas sp.]|nr:glycosyltransferase family 39 protein [Vitreimonas sp.]